MCSSSHSSGRRQRASARAMSRRSCSCRCWDASAGNSNEETKKRRNEGTKKRRNEGTKKRRNEETKKRRNAWNGRGKRERMEFLHTIIDFILHVDVHLNNIILQY